jgi:hypothetical protein
MPPPLPVLEDSNEDFADISTLSVPISLKDYSLSLRQWHRVSGTESMA